jgi:peptidoglycan/LPS O-acetylase OafA/YrhL
MMRVHLNPTGLLLPFLCTLLAMASARLLLLWVAKPRPQRFLAIDGLRGYLALAVFVSHTAIWYFYLRTGHWEVPPSHLYTHLGESSVMLFFMITGLLFYSKLIDGGSRPIDWTRLYVSRLLRLFPLYLFAVLVVFAIVIYLSGAKLHVPLGTLLWRGTEWLAFTLLGGHDLNGVRDTSSIVANVTWSLVYEWIFYASLPLLSLTAGRTPPTPYLVLSVGAMACSVLLKPEPVRLLAFLGGIAAAYFTKNKTICQAAKSNLAGLLALVCIGLDVGWFATAYAPLPIILLSVAFTVIACGNTLFGVLSLDVSRLLGDLSYGIYLLHGIVLFSVFRLGWGMLAAASLSPSEHCVVSLLCTPVVVIAAFAGHRLIELPWMRQVSAVNGWLLSMNRFHVFRRKPAPQ